MTENLTAQPKSLQPTSGSGTPTNEPLLDKFKPLTDKALREWEYDLAKERVEPYIVDMSKELPEQLPLISINGSCICSVGNISAVCGEAKSRKTFLTSAIVASAMAMPLRTLNNFQNVAKNHNLDVLWVDTEQGVAHVRKVIDRISEMSGAKRCGMVSEVRLTTLALRELAPHERKQMMYDAMRLMHYDLVVIDGIADLQRNTNDLEESDALVTELMALSTLAETHILCVLHTNPGSDKARGHLGSSLQRKAETVIFVHRVGDCSVVEPQFCRNEPFERFAFTISEEGIPELCDLPRAVENRNPVVALLGDLYEGSIERATLVSKLVESMGITEKNAQMKIKRLVDKGELVLDNGLVWVGSGSNKSNRVTGVAPAVTTVTAVINDASTESADNQRSNESNTVTGVSPAVTTVTKASLREPLGSWQSLGLSQHEIPTVATLPRNDAAKTTDNQQSNKSNGVTGVSPAVTTVTAVTNGTSAEHGADGAKDVRGRERGRMKTAEEILELWAANGTDIKRPLPHDEDCPF